MTVCLHLLASIGTAFPASRSSEALHVQQTLQLLLQHQWLPSSQVWCRPSDDAGLIAPSCCSTAANATAAATGSICTTLHVKLRNDHHAADCLLHFPAVLSCVAECLITLTPQYPSLSQGLPLPFPQSLPLLLPLKFVIVRSVS